ncbi:MAG TPA: hypothetical protein VEH29_06985, partial [Acidimicrobiales bacterium]|nr:hypothetical protein [Acidimicrobiales bacterium]
MGAVVLVVTFAAGGVVGAALSGAFASAQPKTVAAQALGTNDQTGPGPGSSPGGVANADSSCSPTTDAATSGGSPASLTSSAMKVASGSLHGYAW